MRERMRIFNEYKRQIPPRDLPGDMKDHMLKGPLAGIRECHLASDAVLLYTHNNDVVHMLLVCAHAEIEGARQKSTARRVWGYLAAR